MVHGRSSSQVMPPLAAAPFGPEKSRSSQQTVPSGGRPSPAVKG